MASDSEDQEILGYARDVCHQLGIRRDLRSVMWKDRIEFYRTPPDYVLIYQDELVMPLHYIGSLTIEEFKPLVAAALFHRKILHRELLKGLMTTMVPAFLTMFIGVYTIARLFPDSSSLSRTIVTDSLFASMGLVAFAVYRMGRVLRRIYLKADKLAAQFVGTRAFVRILEKMNSIGFRRRNRWTVVPRYGRESYTCNGSPVRRDPLCV